MGLIGSVTAVITFIHDLFAILPVALRILIVGVPACLIYLGILKMIRGGG